MELKALRYFLAVADCASFSKAAESLYITQPTLSRQIGELENEVGARLFERGSRKAVLTAEGTYFRRRAEEILALETDVLGEMLSRGDLDGKVTLGLTETAAADFIGEAIELFRAEYPSVTFNIITGADGEITDGLDRGVIDVGVLTGLSEIDKYDFLRLGAGERCGVIVSATSPLSGKELTVGDLIGANAAVSGSPRENGFFSSALGGVFEKLNIVATYNLVSGCAMLAKKGTCIVLAREGAARGLDTDVVFRPLRPEVRLPVFAIWKRHQPHSRAVGKFIWKLSELAKIGNDKK